jgi:hypothetical protein
MSALTGLDWPSHLGVVHAVDGAVDPFSGDTRRLEAVQNSTWKRPKRSFLLFMLSLSLIELSQVNMELSSVN